MTEPLIYTSKGNRPIQGLKHEVVWDFGDDFVKLTERYTDEVGDVVKESAHVYSKRGVTAEPVAGSF